MVPILHPLPLDLTGKAPSNIFLSEEHSVFDQAEDPYKVVVLEKGYFYTHDLIVYDHLHKPLIKDVDYQCTALQPQVAKDTAFTACAIIVITNPRINKKVFVTGRYVGGEYCMLTDAIIRMARSLLAGGKRKVYWKNLYDKQSDFRPNGHQHLYWQLYGFAKPTLTVKRMQRAQQVITGRDFNGLYLEWKAIYDTVSNDLQTIEDRLTTHINDKVDPHKVTKLQIKLELVYNGFPATIDEARQGSGAVMDAYATPLRTKEAIEFNFLPKLQNHVADRNNPHGVTYATLGTYNMSMLVGYGNGYYSKGTTTNSAARINNLTWAQVKTNIRTNMYPNEMKSGLLPSEHYSQTAPIPQYILTGSANGYMSWQPIRTMLNTYTKKGNQTFYVTGNQPYVGATWIRVFNTFIGPKPVNSIGVLKSTYYYGSGTGNGSLTVALPTFAMMRYINGSWNF